MINEYMKNTCTFLPVDSNSHESEHTGRDGAGGNELSEATIVLPKGPVTVQHVDKVEKSVHDGNESIRNSQIYQEVVSDSPHALMS